MRYRTLLVPLVAAACVGGCTATGSAPATAPPTTAPSSTPSSTVAASTTSAPETTTIADTTTTTIDRIAEITAIFEDLERRRLAAIASKDLDAFRLVYANERFLEVSLEAFDQVVVTNPSGVQTIAVTVQADTGSCVAVRLDRDYSHAIEGGGRAAQTYVAEHTTKGWGLSWVGEGWLCAGPHPLQP